MVDLGRSARASRASSRIGLAPAVVLFTILLAHAVLETARDAVFLARLGPQHLASAYLAMAGCAVAAVLITRGLGLRDPRRALLRFLAGATLGTAVLAHQIARSSSVVFGFYVWTGFIITLVVPSFWTAIDRVARLAEAKRVFGMIGAGGVLGAMLGSALAGALGQVIAADQLVGVGALAFGLATLAAMRLVPRTTQGDLPVRTPRAEDLSRRSRRYVALLLAVGLISTAALTLGDLTFKRVIAQRLAAERFATAFGLIYAGLNALGLVIQLVVTPRLLARRGVGVTLIVLPLIVIAAALGFALTGAMLAIVALKLGDGSLRHSLHRVSSEILYLPVPAAVRDGGKLVADAIGQRGGQAIAALLALSLGGLGATPRVVAAITAAIGVAWLVALARTRRAYAAQLRATLMAGEIQRDVAMPPFDADSTRVLSRLIASPNEIEALAALDLLARRGRVPACAFDDRREIVVRHALALLGGELPPDTALAVARLRAHPDPVLRAAALAASTRVRFDRPLLERALDDRDPQVRSVALVALAARGNAPAAETQIAALLAGGTLDRLALVTAIGYFPEPRFRPVLDEVLDGSDVAAISQVLRVLAHRPELAELDRLLALLGDARLRADARRVFVAAGARGLARLIRALDTPGTPAAVRRHVPRTISRFRCRTAAAALVTRLVREPDSGSEFKILRALGRMRADQPDLAIEPGPVRDYVRRAIADAARYATLGDAFAALGAPGASTGALLDELLSEKRRTAIERAFRGLGILYPRAGLRSVHDALHSGDEVRRTAAREIIEAIVNADLRPALLAVIDDLAAADRRARLGALAPGPFASHEALVATLLDDPSESLRCVAAYHVAELGLITLRDELARRRAGLARPFVTAAFDQAIARLDA